MSSKKQQLNVFHSKELLNINLGKPKTIVIKSISDKYGLRYYDGENYITDKIDTYTFKSGYTLVECPFCDGIKDKLHKSVEECYDCFIETNKEIKDLTSQYKANKKKIDLGICGRFSHTFLRMLVEFQTDKGGFNNEELREDVKNFQNATFKEYQWFENCSAQFLYANKGFMGEAVLYDKNSWYPYIMQTEDFKIPICEGEETRIDHLAEAYYIDVKGNKKLKYGIYKCRIEATSNSCNTLLKMFKFNDDNTYTHYDIETAIKLEYDIRMLDTHDEPNLLYYTEDKLRSGKYLFGETINHLWELRGKAETKNSKTFIKKIITSGWGMMSQLNLKKVYYKIGDVPVIPNEDYIIYSTEIDKEDPEGRILKLLNSKDPYKTRYGRIKYFLFSKARNKLLEEIMKMKDPSDIVRIHTDGIYVKKESQHKFTLKPTILGGWKIEKDNIFIQVNNVNQVITYNLFEDEDSIIIPEGHEINPNYPILDYDAIDENDFRVLVTFRKIKNIL